MSRGSLGIEVQAYKGHQIIVEPFLSKRYGWRVDNFLYSGVGSSKEAAFRDAKKWIDENFVDHR